MGCGAISSSSQVCSVGAHDVRAPNSLRANEKQFVGICSHEDHSIYAAPGNSEQLWQYQGGLNTKAIDVRDIDQGQLNTENSAKGGQFSGICSHAGKIYALAWYSNLKLGVSPDWADKFLEYDPKTRKVRGIEVSTVLTTTSKFAGICSHGDKIYAAPSYVGKLLECDLETGAVRGIDVSRLGGAELRGRLEGTCDVLGAIHAPFKEEAGFRFHGICSHGGKIYAAPHNFDVLLEFDPETKKLRGIDVTSVATGAGKFRGICGHGGKIYAAPHNSDKLLEYDLKSQEVRGIDVTSVASGEGKFQGICSNGGKIYAAPHSSDKLLEYDPDTTKMRGIKVTAVALGDHKFSGICSHRGDIYAAPDLSSSVLVYKTG